MTCSKHWIGCNSGCFTCPLPFSVFAFWVNADNGVKRIGYWETGQSPAVTANVYAIGGGYVRRLFIDPEVEPFDWTSFNEQGQEIVEEEGEIISPEADDDYTPWNDDETEDENDDDATLEPPELVPEPEPEIIPEPIVVKNVPPKVNELHGQANSRLLKRIGK